MKLIYAFLAGLIVFSTVQAYTLTLSNNFNKPVRFFLEYGSFLCSNDDKTVNPRQPAIHIKTGGCCWHTVGVEVNGQKDTFRVIDVYKSTAEALTMPSCGDQHLWVNGDGYFVVTKDGQDYIVQKLTGA